MEEEEESLTNHPAIRRANAASSSKIQDHVPPHQVIKGSPYHFRIFKASELSESQKSRVWAIFEENMKSIYEASNVFPWDPPDKQKQLFHEYSRFLLVTTASEIDADNEQGLIAYSMFRFERDEGRNVIYVYELQISKSAHRLGLGRALVENLDSIGRVFKSSFLELTHLKSNDAAKPFYDSLGFKIDETSPCCGKEDGDESDEIDGGYFVLSRRINS